jgi:hypothetical protein
MTISNQLRECLYCMAETWHSVITLPMHEHTTCYECWESNPVPQRLRYEGPTVLDMPGAPDQWTVIDTDSPHYRRTNCRETLLDLGFSDGEMERAKINKISLDRGI